MSDWITTGEAAAISRYHPERVREWVRAGAVKGQRPGSHRIEDWPLLLTIVTEHGDPVV